MSNPIANTAASSSSTVNSNSATTAAEGGATAPREIRRSISGSGGGGGFWKQTSNAVPGRPSCQPVRVGGGAVAAAQTNVPGSGAKPTGFGNNTTATGTSSSTTAATLPSSNSNKMANATSSFKVFEQSVSDAWDIREEFMAENMGHPGGRGVAAGDVTSVAAKQIVKMPEPVEVAPSHLSSSSQSYRRDSSSTFCPPETGRPIKHTKVEALVSSPSIELEDLRKLSWQGLTPNSRAKAWKILCGYLPGNAARQEEVILRKQEEYQRYVDQYFRTKDQDIHQETYRQIHIDIPRMSPVVGLFQQRCVQEIFERILYIWAIRHPASGYVQGINDLVTPFFLVFLRECLAKAGKLPDVGGDTVGVQDSPSGGKAVVPSEIDVESALPEDVRNSIEADSFWCLTVVLDGIQDNYTFAQPGIQLKVKQLEDLVTRIDGELHNHLRGNDVAYLQFAFRWMNNLLMRELPVQASIRLWDTYLSQADGFSHFHLYVCAAFLIRWKSELMKKTDFHTLLMFLQNLPTAKWGDSEINLLVAEAYQLSYMFADAPSHLGRKSNSTSSSS